MRIRWCIYPPPAHRSASAHSNASREARYRKDIEKNKLPISWECTDEAFAQLIKERDPTGQVPSRYMQYALHAIALHAILHLLWGTPLLYTYCSVGGAFPIYPT